MNACVHACIYMHVYTHRYLFTHAHTHARTYTQTVHACVHACMYAMHTCIHVCNCMYAHANIPVGIYSHIQVHVCVHVPARTHLIMYRSVYYHTGCVYVLGLHFLAVYRSLACGQYIVCSIIRALMVE